MNTVIFRFLDKKKKKKERKKERKKKKVATFRAGSTKQVIYKTWSIIHLSSSNKAVVSALFHSNTELEMTDLSWACEAHIEEEQHF